MTQSINKDEIKKILLEIIEEDNKLKILLIENFLNYFVTKAEYGNFLKEIKDLNQNLINQMQLFGSEMKQMREDFSSEMKQMREDFNARLNAFETEMKQMREDFNARLNAFETEMRQMREDFSSEMKKMREDFNLNMKRMSERISAIGARWGIYNEESIRRGIINILKDRTDLEIKKWKVYDEKGIVYARSSFVECDILIRDNEHELIEIKSSTKKSDVTELLRIAELYELKEGIKPKLRIITAYIDPRARAFAEETGVEISSPENL